MKTGTWVGLPIRGLLILLVVTLAFTASWGLQNAAGTELAAQAIPVPQLQVLEPGVFPRVKVGEDGTGNIGVSPKHNGEHTPALNPEAAKRVLSILGLFKIVETGGYKFDPGQDPNQRVIRCFVLKLGAAAVRWSVWQAFLDQPAGGKRLGNIGWFDKDPTTGRYLWQGSYPKESYRADRISDGLKSYIDQERKPLYANTEVDCRDFPPPPALAQ